MPPSATAIRAAAHATGVGEDAECVRVVEPAERSETRFVLECAVEVPGRQPAFTEDVKERAGIDGARARRHRHALEPA